jgi:hypothetical protein
MVRGIEDRGPRLEPLEREAPLLCPLREPRHRVPWLEPLRELAGDRRPVRSGRELALSQLCGDYAKDRAREHTDEQEVVTHERSFILRSIERHLDQQTLQGAVTHRELALYLEPDRLPGATLLYN